MARYVVLYFEDNAEAESLVHRHDPLNPQEGELKALVPAPTKFCDGAACILSGSKRGRGWTRGLKFGWWVCSICRKPSRRWGQSYAAVLGAGKNLLDDSDPLKGSIPGYDQSRGE